MKLSLVDDWGEHYHLHHIVKADDSVAALNEILGQAFDEAARPIVKLQVAVLEEHG